MCTSHFSFYMNIIKKQYESTLTSHLRKIIQSKQNKPHDLLLACNTSSTLNLRNKWRFRPMVKTKNCFNSFITLMPLNPKLFYLNFIFILHVLFTNLTDIQQIFPHQTCCKLLVVLVIIDITFGNNRIIQFVSFREIICKLFIYSSLTPSCIELVLYRFIYYF